MLKLKITLFMLRFLPSYSFPQISQNFFCNNSPPATGEGEATAVAAVAAAAEAGFIPAGGSPTAGLRLARPLLFFSGVVGFEEDPPPADPSKD